VIVQIAAAGVNFVDLLYVSFCLLNHRLARIGPDISESIHALFLLSKIQVELHRQSCEDHALTVKYSASHISLTFLHPQLPDSNLHRLEANTKTIACSSVPLSS
jgi:hypothetical protein